jgi:hypothetical protein
VIKSSGRPLYKSECIVKNLNPTFKPALIRVAEAGGLDSQVREARARAMRAELTVFQLLIEVWDRGEFCSSLSRSVLSLLCFSLFSSLQKDVSVARVSASVRPQLIDSPQKSGADDLIGQFTTSLREIAIFYVR